MKNLIAFAIFALALSVLASTATMAEETIVVPAEDTTGSVENVVVADSTNTEAELGLNESVSAGKIAWKQIRLWFTFNQERKLEGELDLARLRLIQAEIAGRNNDSAAMEKALEAHEAIMNRAETRMAALKLADSSQINETVSKLVGLERAIQVHEKRIAFISNLLANANLTEAQKEKLEAKLVKVENVTAKLGELNQAKQDQTKIRLMAVENLSESEANQLIEDAKEHAKGNAGKETAPETETENTSA